MTIINHGTFAVYTPARPELPEQPVAPAVFSRTGVDDAETPEQAAQRAADETAHAAAMAEHQAAMAVWREAHARASALQQMIDAKFVFARRGDGADWYDVNHGLPSGNYGIVENGIVIDTGTDPTAFGLTDGMTLIEDTSGPIQGRWTWDGATLSPPQITAEHMRAECKRRIAADLGVKRGSINSYGVALNGKVSIGIMKGQPIEQSLTAEELSDVQLLWAIDAWEGQMIAVREQLAAEPSKAAFDDATWPPKPDGLNVTWLNGF